MQHDPLAWLSNVCKAIDHAAAFAHGRDLTDYRGERMFRSGVERQFEIISEALAQIVRVASEIAARIPDLLPASAMRNALIHGYYKIVGETI